MFYEPFFGTKSGSEKGSKFDVWFFRELSSKIAQLPPLLLHNPILHKHKRKEYIVLSLQFMVDCCLRIPRRDLNENCCYRWQSECLSGVVRHCVILAIVSDAHDRYLGYTRLNVEAQRMKFQDEAPRVGKILSFYTGVRRDTFLDVYSRSECGVYF